MLYIFSSWISNRQDSALLGLGKTWIEKWAYKKEPFVLKYRYGIRRQNTLLTTKKACPFSSPCELIELKMAREIFVA